MLWNNPIPERQKDASAASAHRESAELHTFLNPKQRLAASYIVTMKTRHALSSRPTLFLLGPSDDGQQGRGYSDVSPSDGPQGRGYNDVSPSDGPQGRGYTPTPNS